jgi:hypothetical protein
MLLKTPNEFPKEEESSASIIPPNKNDIEFKEYISNALKKQ